MWYDVITSDILSDDSALHSAIAQDGEHAVFIIDGPTGCGKSRFVNRLSYERKLRIPAHLLTEALFFEQRDIGGNKRMMLYFLTQLNVDIFCIEDIDVVLCHFEATQKLFAEMIIELSEHSRVLLTGTEIRRRCAVLTEALQGRYRLFRYTEQ